MYCLSIQQTGKHLTKTISVIAGSPLTCQLLALYWNHSFRYLAAIFRFINHTRVVNILIDLVVLKLPIPDLRSLQMALYKELDLTETFSIGFLWAPIAPNSEVNLLTNPTKDMHSERNPTENYVDTTPSWSKRHHHTHGVKEFSGASIRNYTRCVPLLRPLFGQRCIGTDIADGTTSDHLRRHQLNQLEDGQADSQLRLEYIRITTVGMNHSFACNDALRVYKEILLHSIWVKKTWRVDEVVAKKE